ncbi:hypothetical protein AA700_1238 [Acidiphilium acidophilum DSM 700]|nr:hypothetical protein AA700_1238 [Acidiphilium acidophilum DSM 700]
MPRDNQHENRIAPPAMLPRRDLLPHINAPDFGYFMGAGDEEGQYGDERLFLAGLWWDVALHPHIAGVVSMHALPSADFADRGNDLRAATKLPLRTLLWYRMMI